MSASELHYRSISELAEALRRRDLSPVELTQHFIDRASSLDGTLNAFRLLCPERALAEARSAESALLAGCDRGPLHGIPYVAKDLFDVRGLPTSAGCRRLEQTAATRDATVVDRLARAGMVLLGKTNTVQLAYGGAGINHDHGTPHNPWHPEPHLPGGSSSGTAVAVAAGMAPMGLGSDTGGSVRIPAAFCGVTGLKTTVGQISRAGVYPLSWSLDSVGPLARTAADAALVYDAMQGEDRHDDSTAGRARHEVSHGLEAGLGGLRLAFGESAFWDEAQPEVASAVRDCAGVFEDLGARVASIPFESARGALELNPRGLVIAAEAYTLNRELLEEHFDELDPVIATRMIKGKAISAAQYLQTTLDWKRLRARAVAELRDVDALLCPATMIAPSPVADADRDVATYSKVNLQCLRNTAIGNVLDLCGLSVPCGFTGSGLPIGLMIYGKPFTEHLVLRVGHAFQCATDWHLRRPDLTWAG